MAVQLAEAAKTAAGIDVTVEESQGSVQNVKEAIRRSGGYVFTSPPSLVASAVAARKPFEGESGYDQIRSLFPIPALTMHRSDERRVGKKCASTWRSRWSPYHKK